VPLPERLQEIVDQFAAAPRELRVQALLGFANRVPPLPERWSADTDRMEQVHECQTPFFLAVEVDEDRTVQLWFDCPPEAPTVRGFAGILREGLEGAGVDQVLAVPPDFYRSMGLAEVVSALRLRGMGAILARLQRQVRERSGAAAKTPSEEEDAP
jgi:cysteine desulfuration protein SufE